MKLNPIALLVATACMSAGAQEIAEITVSAMRTPMALSQTPASVSVVTQEDFTAAQAATVGDVLRKLPNVEFGGGPRSDGELPTIRGYQGNDITLIVDGARRNANYSLTTPLFLDPFFLSRAEVVRGSTSSLYGSGGLGGAMVFNTISARELLKEGRTSGVDTRVGYGSGDNSSRTSGRVYGVKDDLDAVLAVTYSDFNEIEQPSGAKLTPNRGHGFNALAKVGWQGYGLTRYEFSHQSYSRSALEDNNPQRNKANSPYIQPTHNSQAESVFRFLNIDRESGLGWDAKIYQTTTTNQRDAYRDANAIGGCTSVPNSACPYWNSEISTRGFSVQNNTKMSDYSSHTLTYGLDGFVDQLATIQGSAVNPVNPDGKRQVLGTFVQDIFVLSQGVRFVPSLRYDEFNATPSDASLKKSTDSHVSPKATLSWQASPSLNLYGSYGEAFRAPTLWEMYTNSQVTGFRRFHPNPDLKAQTDTTFELGSRYAQKGVWSSKDRLSLYGALFVTKADNLIQQVTIEGSVGAYNSKLQYQNVQHATRKGGELGAGYALDLWTVDAGYSRVRVVNDDTGENLFASPDKLTTRVSYVVPQSRVKLVWGMTAVAAQDYDATSLRRRAGYATHDMSVTWMSAKQDYRLDAGIYNLGNKQYVVYQSSNADAVNAYEMGRNYRISLSASF
ncbi:MAG: hypothetical protein RLZ36_628 [Pseudomonadota bacterium]|jgi:hemoglobin/transferrin/lactoferrin receptor protein